MEELETVEKLNIFGISKPKIMTEKPNKISIYTESRTANRTLQLYIIKRHNLPNKWSQRHEIKILNSKKV